MNLTDVAPGTYRLYLRLADDTLPDRPEYAIQTANQGLWNPATGDNFMHRIVRVREWCCYLAALTGLFGHVDVRPSGGSVLLARGSRDPH